MTKSEQLIAEKEVLEEGLDLQEAFIETTKINLINAKGIDSERLEALYTNQLATMQKTLKTLKKCLKEKNTDIQNHEV